MIWIAADTSPDYGGPTSQPYVPLPARLEQAPLMSALQMVIERQGLLEAAADTKESLTFDGLLSLASGIADELDRVAAGPVCISLPPGPAYMAAIWACLLVGRVAVLLDPTNPSPRNAAIARAAGAHLVIVQTYEGAPCWPGVTPVSVSRCNPGGPTRTASPADVDRPAFCLSTSGSTGTPKLIAHSQRTLAHWIISAHDALHLGASDRVLTLSPPATLSALAALLGSPLAGAPTAFVDIRSQGVKGLLDTFARAPITILRSTPSLVKGLARIPEMRLAWSSLRVLQCYGEALTRKELNVLQSVLPAGCLVRVTYGATEANGISRFFGGIEQREGPDAARLPAGRLMRGAEARIVGPSGEDVPTGEIGELVLRSSYSAIGEWVDGCLVAGRLPADPHHRAARIYRTGDLARRDADGEFIILGRTDRMMKIHGQRLDLGEVEAALRRHPSLIDAIVLAIGSETMPLLVGFCVGRDGQEPVIEEIASWANEHLPSWMIPTRLIKVASLPIMPSGKTDIDALRQMARDPIAL